MRLPLTNTDQQKDPRILLCKVFLMMICRYIRDVVSLLFLRSAQLDSMPCAAGCEFLSGASSRYCRHCFHHDQSSRRDVCTRHTTYRKLSDWWVTDRILAGRACP